MNKPFLPALVFIFTAVVIVLIGVLVVPAKRSTQQSLIATAETNQQPASSPPKQAPAESTTSSNKSSAVRAEMHNVLFHFTDASGAHIEQLSGELLPTPGNEMPVFDDRSSFEVVVSTARISITPSALSDIFNSFVMNKPDAPLKELSMAVDQGRLHIKGKLHSKGDLPFETIGNIFTTSDGRLRIQTESVKALKIPVKGVMNLFGIELANLINTSKIPGMDTDKNDLLIDLSTLLPPPHIKGRLTGVSIKKGVIVAEMKGPAPAADLPSQKGNFMTFRGNHLRFGKLTMTDSDLSIVDMNPIDPLDWNQSRYQEQLEAGYSKINSNFGLITYVKDFGKLTSSRATQSKSSP
jgi:hypothetical protein